MRRIALVALLSGCANTPLDDATVGAIGVAAQAELALATQAWRTEDWATAQAHVQRARALSMPPATMGRLAATAAQMHFDVGRFDEARRLWTQALDSLPDRPKADALFARARMHHELGDMKAATADLDAGERLLYRFDDGSPAQQHTHLFWRARVAMSQREWLQTERILDRMGALHAAHPSAALQRDLDFVYGWMKRQDYINHLAVPALAKAMVGERDPKRLWRLWFETAVAQIALKNLPAVLEAFERALAVLEPLRASVPADALRPAVRAERRAPYATFATLHADDRRFDAYFVMQDRTHGRDLVDALLAQAGPADLPRLRAELPALLRSPRLTARDHRATAAALGDRPAIAWFADDGVWRVTLVHGERLTVLAIGMPEFELRPLIELWRVDPQNSALAATLGATLLPPDLNVPPGPLVVIPGPLSDLPLPALMRDERRWAEQWVFAWAPAYSTLRPPAPGVSPVIERAAPETLWGGAFTAQLLAGAPWVLTPLPGADPKAIEEMLRRFEAEPGADPAQRLARIQRALLAEGAPTKAWARFAVITGS